MNDEEPFDEAIPWEDTNLPPEDVYEAAMELIRWIEDARTEWDR